MDKKSLLLLRVTNWAEYRQLVTRRMNKRIDRDLAAGNIDRAIGRLESFLQCSPIDQEIHYQLGNLYRQIGDEIKAGKHWYFKQNPTPEELKCIHAFERSLGGCPIAIAKKLIYQQRYKINECSPFLKERHLKLIQAIEAKFHVTPSFFRESNDIWRKAWDNALRWIGENDSFRCVRRFGELPIAWCTECSFPIARA